MRGRPESFANALIWTPVNCLAENTHGYPARTNWGPYLFLDNVVYAPKSRRCSDHSLEHRLNNGFQRRSHKAGVCRQDGECGKTKLEVNQLLVGPVSSGPLVAIVRQ
ncbi:hypothetical protein R1flu_014464 [Riccia fluitans]|uniref:Uncharacterized protein n=1 Tax=Riccia fluitans TaxID=41844 RepID=A0ABD1YG70_9MARC